MSDKTETNSKMNDSAISSELTTLSTESAADAIIADEYGIAEHLRESTAENTAFEVGEAMPSYPFQEQTYSDMPSLITALASNWNEGKNQLYHGLLSTYFKGFNSEIAGYCIDAENESACTTLNDDFIFWKLLYRIYPRLNGFYWMGEFYESLSALGRDMLEKLWTSDSSDHLYWDSILSNKLITGYLSTVDSDNKDLAAAASAIEALHGISNKSQRDSMMNYYLIAYLLSGQRLLAIGDKRLKSVPELTAHMKDLLDSSYEEFEDFCHSLIDYDDTLDLQLEAWLIAIGREEELNAWKQSLQASTE